MASHARTPQKNEGQPAGARVQPGERAEQGTFRFADNRSGISPQKKVLGGSDFGLQAKEAVHSKADAKGGAPWPVMCVQKKETSMGAYGGRCGTGVIQRDGDAIEDTVLDKDIGKVTEEVNVAMLKIKTAIVELASQSADVAGPLQESGRDWVVYSPLFTWRHDLISLVTGWDFSWSLEDTAGLLVDLGVTLRHVAIEGVGAQPLMNKYMEETRQADKKINPESGWAKDLPEGTKTQAGVSASTANLLRMIRGLNVNTPLEIEAIMNGVIRYWNNSTLKQALGQFHTAAEVWAAYTYHLEEYVLNTRRAEPAPQVPILEGPPDT